MANTVNLNERDNFFVELVKALKTTDKPMREIYVYQENGFIRVADNVASFFVTLFVEPSCNQVTVVEQQHVNGETTEYGTHLFKVTDLQSVVDVITSFHAR